MHPFIEIFGIKIPAYGVMLVLAIFTAYFSVAYFSQREKLDFSKLETLFFAIFISSFIGARVFYVAEHGQWKEIYALWKGGMDFFGGFIFGGIALLVGLKLLKLPFWKVLDIAGISVLLAHSVGRLSCWLAGCCYGKPTDLPIGVVFPPGAVAPSGIPLYPTQVMEATGNFIGYLVLYWLYKRKPFDGFIIASYLLWYGTERFLLEFIRGTTPPLPGLGLTWNQVVCLFAIAVGVGLIVFRFIQTRRAF
jgi:phosphatidylglycerol:prolipoprotein diacylglycerol transferase